MKEKIGAVVLDTTLWPGEDLYSDGPVEREMLEIVRSCPPGGEEACLCGEDRYPFLYHFSPERENILSWYPFTPGMDVLEVGAGCGAITGLLARRCGSVTALDISRTRSRINAWRHRDAANLTILVRNLFDLPRDRKYDVITLIGVLEYAALFTDSPSPFEDVLRLLGSLLKEGGRLLIAIENRLGLKYMNGAREDHLWKLYAGLEGYAPKSPETFTRGELDALLARCGFGGRAFYYPFPDYKFPRQVFSDAGQRWFSLVGDEFANHGEYVFAGADQGRVFRSLADDLKAFATLSNSFFVAAGREGGEPLPVLYTRMATARARRFAIQTLFCANAPGGETLVVKEALGDRDYMPAVARAARVLEERCPGLRAGDVRLEKGRLVYAYSPGTPLSQALRAPEGRATLLRRYREALLPLCAAEPVDFAQEPGVRSVFGALEAPPARCARPAPIDLTFDNILIEPDGGLRVIDTEWVFDLPLPLHYILWRAAYALEEQQGVPRGEVLEALGVPAEETALYAKMEEGFRAYVFPADAPKQYNERYRARAPRLADALVSREGPYASLLMALPARGEEEPQIVPFDHDRAVNEQTFPLEAPQAGRRLRYTPLRGRMSRILPLSLRYDDREIDPAALETNASSWSAEEGWLFETFDPYVVLPPVPAGTKALHVRLRHALLYDGDVERAMLEYRRRAGERDFLARELEREQGEAARAYAQRDAALERIGDKDEQIAALYAERDAAQVLSSQKDEQIAALYAERDAAQVLSSQKDAQIAALYAERDAAQVLSSQKDEQIAALYAERDAAQVLSSQKDAQIAALYAERDAAQVLSSQKDEQIAALYAERDKAQALSSQKDAQIAALYAERDEAQALSSRKNEQIAALYTERDAAQSAAARKDEEIAALCAQRDGLSADLSAREARIAELGAREEEQAARIARLEGELAALNAAAWTRFGKKLRLVAEPGEPPDRPA